MAVQTTGDDNVAGKKLDVKASYEEYQTGKRTINDIADEHNVPAQQVVDAFEAHVQGNKKDAK